MFFFSLRESDVSQHSTGDSEWKPSFHLAQVATGGRIKICDVDFFRMKIRMLSHEIVDRHLKIVPIYMSKTKTNHGGGRRARPPAPGSRPAPESGPAPGSEAGPQLEKYGQIFHNIEGQGEIGI